MDQAESNTTRIDTVQLGRLREIRARLGFLQAAVGDIATFRVVVDANFVIRDLLQMVKYPERTTALVELVKATVFEVHAPRWLDTEMMSAIEKAAKKRKVSSWVLIAKWLEYRELLKWDDELAAPPAANALVCDPKDLPYVQLERKIGAVGILSEDKHIRKLGGHPLKLEFALTARGYARYEVQAISARIAGQAIPVFMIWTAATLLRQAARAFARLSPAAQGLIILGVVVALTHPTSRKWIAEQAEMIGKGLSVVASSVAELTARATETGALAMDQLTAASTMVRPRASAPTRRRRKVAIRRRRAPVTVTVQKE
jgi:predicted nucleic acid-binding protein